MSSASASTSSPIIIPEDMRQVFDRRVSYHILVPFLLKEDQRAEDVDPVQVMLEQHSKWGRTYCLNYYMYSKCQCSFNRKYEKDFIHILHADVKAVRQLGVTNKKLQKWSKQHFKERIQREQDELAAEEQRKKDRIKEEEEEKLRLEAKAKLEQERLAKERELYRAKALMDEEQRVKRRLQNFENLARTNYSFTKNFHSVATICACSNWNYQKHKIRFAQGSTKGTSQRRWVCTDCFVEVIQVCPDLFDEHTLFSQKYLSRMEPRKATHLKPKLVSRIDPALDPYPYGPQRSCKWCEKDGICEDRSRCISWRKVTIDLNETKREKYEYESSTRKATRAAVHRILQAIRDAKSKAKASSTDNNACTSNKGNNDDQVKSS